MSKDLLVDIGNSNTALAEYSGGKIKEIKKIKSLKNYDRVIVSSVAPSKNRRFKNALFVTHKNIPELRLNMEKPAEVGADRLVNALAAYTHYGSPCLIVDSGTAVTFCVVTGNGIYQGGVIFPGMRIASQALNSHTEKIPLIFVSKRKTLTGKTTKQAVQAGLYFGYIHLINGIIADYRKQIPGLRVIGAGKGLNILKDQLSLDYFDPLLTLRGLAIVADNHV